MDALERAEFEVKTFGHTSKESGLNLIKEVTRLRQLLSEAETREREARAKAVEDVLSALTAHELYQYRPKAFQGFIDYARSTLQPEERGW